MKLEWIIWTLNRNIRRALLFVESIKLTGDGRNERELELVCGARAGGCLHESVGTSAMPLWPLPLNSAVVDSATPTA